MNMRMIEQVLAPGVENGKKADLSAEMFGVTGKRLKCLGHSLKEKRVKRFFVTQGKGIKLVRQRKNHMEIRNRKKVDHALLYPLRTGQGLAFRAVAVSVGVYRDAPG